MLWFNFILGSNFLNLLFLGMVMYDNNMIMSLKQKKRKFEPRIKLNHNTYTCQEVAYYKSVAPISDHGCFQEMVTSL